MITTDIDKKFDENKYQTAKEVWDEYDTYRAEQWKLNRIEIIYQLWLDSKLKSEDTPKSGEIEKLSHRHSVKNTHRSY